MDTTLLDGIVRLPVPPPSPYFYYFAKARFFVAVQVIPDICSQVSRYFFPKTIWQSNIGNDEDNMTVHFSLLLQTQCAATVRRFLFSSLACDCSFCASLASKLKQRTFANISLSQFVTALEKISDWNINLLVYLWLFLMISDLSNNQWYFWVV